MYLYVIMATDDIHHGVFIGYTDTCVDDTVITCRIIECSNAKKNARNPMTDSEVARCK